MSDLSSATARMLVTGDVVRDIYIYQGDRIFPAQHGKIAPHLSDKAGGAKGLYEMIHAARPDDVDWGLQEPSLEALEPVYTLWTACEGGTKKEHEDAAKGKKPVKVWRVGQPLGYALSGAQFGALRRSAAAEKPHAVLVIDDAGLVFRTQPAATSWPTGILRSDKPEPAWIIQKMANPIAQGDLWRELIGGSNPDRRNNLIVIVSADELRRAGAAISRGFSWERTLSELCLELDENPVFQPLLRFSGRLIVNFGCVGTIWFDNSYNPKQCALKRARLVYDPALPEGGWKTLLADDHAVWGHLNTFTATIAFAAGDATLSTPADLDAAIERGIKACRQLRLSGHGSVQAPEPVPPQLTTLLSPPVIPSGFEVVSIASGANGSIPAATWNLAALAENPPDQQHLPLYGLAHRVALYGHSALSHIPHAHFGDLLSVDRLEIETLRSLTQLIQRYEREKQPKQPLSIAAFGPPGAGKSFGIKEIARQVLGKDVPILEFNISQFDSASDLFGAFHQVRDKALKGFVPVVFWDEFDSRNYHWLQYLLAPMQDGTFEENGHTHTIGKCLFVFAGGTSWDFEHFGPAPMPEGWQPAFLRHLRRKSGDAPAAADPAPEPNSAVAQLVEFYRHNHDRIVADQAASDDFRRKKGPDFLSRLDGHIDVLGPNQRRCYDWAMRSWDTPDRHDITFPIRRALLLRQFLGAKEPEDSLAIDRDLLRAFLQVPHYRHGVRSLEKIARHLVLSRPPFRRAALPPPQVLTQHLVSAEAFEHIYQETQRLLTPQAIEALADAINEVYNHYDRAGGTGRSKTSSHSSSKATARPPSASPTSSPWLDCAS